MSRLLQNLEQGRISGREARPRRRPSRLRNSPSDDLPHLFRTLELLQQKDASPQLERRVRVRADRPRDIVFLRKPTRLTIELRQHAARVINLDCIHHWQNFEQILFPPAA